jgi:hypothetical protein
MKKEGEPIEKIQVYRPFQRGNREVRNLMQLNKMGTGNHDAAPSPGDE